jgi:hypothetical protein
MKIHQSSDVRIDHALKWDPIEKFFDGKILLILIFATEVTFATLNDQILFALRSIETLLARFAHRQTGTTQTNNGHFFVLIFDENFFNFEKKRKTLNLFKLLLLLH